MSSESEHLESFYSASTFKGLIRSCQTLLRARRVKPRSVEDERGIGIDFRGIRTNFLFYSLIVIPAFFLNVFQTIRTATTGKLRTYPEGVWQFYLNWGLREDLAHHTNETVGYHQNRPEEATELDDLTAWVMTVTQFVWGYEELMGVIWDEWTWLRLLHQAADEAGLQNHEVFRRLTRQWEVRRPYSAPLNGTYADVRWATFYAFTRRNLNILPHQLQEAISQGYIEIANQDNRNRKGYQKQMSLLARLVPGKFSDEKEFIPLWEASIAVVYGGMYHLIHLVAHDELDRPVVYASGGNTWALQFKDDKPMSPDGEELYLDGAQFYRVSDDTQIGYLDIAPASYVEWQLKQILSLPRPAEWENRESVDILLAETPRNKQKGLREMLPTNSQKDLKRLSYAPVVINWDQKPRDKSLAELRRTHRGIGDHPLTIIRTEDSIIFDQSHIFFDGTWSMAMAEVLTNSAVNWCGRVINITPSAAPPIAPLSLKPSDAFLTEARKHQQVPEISAETTIYDIQVLFQLRKALLEIGTRLTINDLLIITRIFHASHYSPSPSVAKEIADFQENAKSAVERRAKRAIDLSLERGRLRNPALLIPVDASLLEPQERIFPITFRNLADSLVWVWDDTWDAYQAYRKIEPPDTPEGIKALMFFAKKRKFLIGNLRAFSHILAANKSVAMRGDTLNVEILKLLVALPAGLQHLLNVIPDQFSVLNEILKGDEVYSNVGRVSKGSTLTRFMTAKDDGSTKALAWGIMTDDQGQMIITMRDFRPHVEPLIRAGRIDLARNLATDYVRTYTYDLMGLVAKLTAMLQTETPN